jgi:hypothetical protein
MHFYEHRLHQVTLNLLEQPHQDQINRKSQITLKDFRELLLQCPDLIRIFQARRLFLPSSVMVFHTVFRELFTIHTILDLSWDDIQKCICSLRPHVTQDPDSFYTIALSVPALCWELQSLHPQAIISRDLACGLIQLMHQLQNPDMFASLWYKNH